MESFVKNIRHKDTETALETVIPGIIAKNRNINTIKASSGAINQLLESEGYDSVTNKK